MLLEMNSLIITTSLVVFLGVVLLLVIVLLIAKRYLVTSGDVKITLNGEKEMQVAAGTSLLNAMSNAVSFYHQPVEEKVLGSMSLSSRTRRW